MTEVGGEGPRSSGRDRRPIRLLLLLGVVAAGIALVGSGLLAAQPPASPAGSSPSSSGAAVRPPAASTAPDAQYDAVFAGDASGATDVSEELSAFLEAHDGQRVALAVDGVYKVTRVPFTASDLTLDFRGAQLTAIERGAYGILVIVSGSNVVLNDPFVVGTGYEWNGGDDNPDQWEHEIEVNGGSNITLNRPRTRDMRGDGIYVGFDLGKNRPASGVVINNPDLVRSSRNGIAPVAGEVTVIGGTIKDSGLHGIDFEPNNDEGAMSIVGIVRGVDIRGSEGLDVFGLTGYAVAAAGYSTAPKPSLVIEDLTGDQLDMRIHNAASLVIRRNVSDTQTTAVIVDPGRVDFRDNVRIGRA